MMTCEMTNLEIEWSLCSALMWSFVADWAQSTNQLTNNIPSVNTASHGGQIKSLWDCSYGGWGLEPSAEPSIGQVVCDSLHEILWQRVVSLLFLGIVTFFHFCVLVVQLWSVQLRCLCFSSLSGFIWECHALCVIPWLSQLFCSGPAILCSFSTAWYSWPFCFSLHVISTLP